MQKIFHLDKENAPQECKGRKFIHIITSMSCDNLVRQLVFEAHSSLTG